MTPQHRASPQISTQQGEEASTHEKKKMKTMLQRRRAAQSVISRALSKPRAQSRAGISVERCPWHVNQPDASVTRGSFFVMEDHVHLTSGLQTQERHLFLFTDVLIIAKSKSSASLKVKAQVQLSEMWLASCVDQVTERKLSSKNSFVIGWPTTNYVVTLSSTEIKEKWLSTLKWYIIQSKQNELPAKIVMRVTVLDDCVTTAALQLDSSATAENIIETVTLQYGLRGPPAEYQLWVEAAGEEAPCVLIGHECPYSIVLHHLRLTECLPMVLSSLLTAEGTLHLELLPREVPVPLFTLRARSARHHPFQADFSQKHRRKRSLIDWALRRGVNSQSSCPPDSPCSALFSQPLSNICLHGSPPHPVMDMLYVLYQQGPATQGIFRRSANAKCCRELKEKLNSGMEYLPQGESVLVIAAVFTDFLRSLPGSILGSHLCERWMDVLDVEPEKRKAVIASLIVELPEENGTLLRYLFWVLYRIHQHSEDNQMTAHNLALCIAPNMLTLPLPSSAEEETKAMKKVAELIQLLIESTPSIFGEDVGGLLSQWKNVRNEHAVCEETNLHTKQMVQRAASSVSLLCPPDPFILPLATLALHEDVGFTMPSGSSVSVCSIPASLGHLRSSWDRCASEPTVCPAHIPVARQSSCDATVMGGSSGGQSQSPSLQARHFMAKQKPSWRGGEGGSSPQTGKGRYAFWRSPQIAPRFQRHMASGHHLPSLSSLSSTATSSLSSLDSALSLTSSEPLSSPIDTAARPFLFGAAARLRPLTPDVPRKFPPDWSMAFPHEEEDGEEKEEEEEEEVEEREEDFEEATRQTETGKWDKVTEEEVTSSTRWKGLPDVRVTACPGSPAGDEEQVLWSNERWDGDCEQRASGPHRSQGEVRGTSVTHIKLNSSGVRSPLSLSPQPTASSLPEAEKMQRTKITFYASSGTLTIKEPACHLATDALAGDSPVPAGAAGGQNHRVRVHIPQTVFYGQSVPLVLHSVSTRVPMPVPVPSAHSTTADGVDSAHSRPTQTRITLSGGISLSNNARHRAPTVNGAEGTVAVQMTDTNQDMSGSGSGSGRGSPVPTVPPNSGPLNSPKPHGRASAGIRHTIRIKLPTMVRNTVREYFSHREGIGPGTSSQTAAMEEELVIKRMQWQRRDPHCSPSESCQASTLPDNEKP